MSEDQYAKYREYDKHYRRLEFNQEAYERILRNPGPPRCPFCERKMLLRKGTQEYYCCNTDCTKKDWR